VSRRMTSFSEDPFSEGNFICPIPFLPTASHSGWPGAQPQGAAFR
jgi:hypothetical protein